MFNLPETELSGFVVTAAVFSFLVIHVVKMIRAEVSHRQCDLCDKWFRPEDFTNHVTVCALKKMLHFSEAQLNSLALKKPARSRSRSGREDYLCKPASPSSYVILGDDNTSSPSSNSNVRGSSPRR